ncbi:MAG TPA: hypothetical protein VEA69_15070, partial [Tepidisphaeraceae bacterium]|nr:hypothetical protein [Tepidisphaeraceae bacterium]
MRVIRPSVASVVACALLLVVRDAPGKSFLPKEDLKIAALDLRTGKRLWTFDPKSKLSQATIEVYPEGIVVRGERDAGNKPFPPTTLDKAGRPAAFDRAEGRVLARSAGFWPPAGVSLANGWQLKNYSPGNTTKLEFGPPDGAIAWTIDAGKQYPHTVAAKGRFVAWAVGYLAKDAIVHGYEVGGA